jgi:tetratricopeptide (TPR) repeat protein
MHKSFISVLAFLFLTQTVFAVDYIDLVKKGNQALKAKDNKKALDLYRQAETEIPESPELNYNLGGALHEEGNFEEAIERFQRSLNTVEPKQEASAHYNLGNTYFRQQDYQKAIASYQEALTLNPDDMDSKFNLELSRKMLKEQIKPEQQNNQQQQQQNQEQDQQQQQQQNQNQQEQEQQDPQDKKDQQQQQKSQQPNEQKMSKEDAERILNALKDDEKDIQKKVQRQVKAGNYSGKDW